MCWRGLVAQPNSVSWVMFSPPLTEEAPPLGASELGELSVGGAESKGREKCLSVD
jgi:hypothetical protein